jgi:hypothetical protein
MSYLPAVWAIGLALATQLGLTAIFLFLSEKEHRSPKKLAALVARKVRHGHLHDQQAGSSVDSHAAHGDTSRRNGLRFPELAEERRDQELLPELRQGDDQSLLRAKANAKERETAAVRVPKGPEGQGSEDLWDVRPPISLVLGKLDQSELSRDWHWILTYDGELDLWIAQPLGRVFRAEKNKGEAGVLGGPFPPDPKEHQGKAWDEDPPRCLTCRTYMMPLRETNTFACIMANCPVGGVWKRIQAGGSVVLERLDDPRD